MGGEQPAGQSSFPGATRGHPFNNLPGWDAGRELEPPQMEPAQIPCLGKQLREGFPGMKLLRGGGKSGVCARRAVILDSLCGDLEVPSRHLSNN